MSKRRLTKKQSRQISANQNKKLQEITSNSIEPAANKQNLVTGQICAHYGKSIELFDEQQVRHACALRQNLPPLVVGDWVSWQPSASNSLGSVHALSERSSLIGRQNKQGLVKVIAANITRLFIVVASKPEFKPELLDRYLINAHFFGIEPVIIFNKTDLLTNKEQQETQQLLESYQALGYEVLYASTKLNQGIDELLLALKAQTSVFVGQSGVGKSSLLNIILPSANASVGSLSDKNTTGKHTTTTARLYYLNDGSGSIIDSPGIRDLLLSHLDNIEVAKGFIEFRPFLNTCYYRDCKHMNEPHCAIKQAVLEGDISTARYQHYKAILSET